MAYAEKSNLMIGFPLSTPSVSVRFLSMRLRLSFLLWLLACSFASAELVIGKPEWGFDGTAVTDAFNILTVDVRNTSGQPYEGVITLDDGGGFGARDAAPYLQKVFIAPGATRSVQFYPYFASGYSDFRITWNGPAGGKVPVDSPDSGAPAVVLLADLDAPNLRNVRMRAFNEANFPPTVSATDGLRALVMDHQPKWDPARREAFLDWLKRGGLVHIINGSDGAAPQFSGDLAVLNDPAPRFSVGGGLAVRHATTRAEITSEFLNSAGFPNPQSSKDAQNLYYDGDYGIFRDLSTVTKPNIAWGLIYTLTFVYVGLVGPAFYFLRKRDHRVLIGGFVATVALFAWIFTVIGRRGYGEKQVYHSVAVARWIEGSKWDVRHWMHAFATSGGTYRFAMPGVSHLYASHGEGGGARSEVLQGREAALSSDIPLFSSRPFHHQGVMEGPGLAWEVRSLALNANESGPSELQLKQPGGLNGQVTAVVAQYGLKFYVLQEGNGFPGEWRLPNKTSRSLGDAFGGIGVNEGYNSYGENTASAFARLRGGAARLAQRFTGSADNNRVPLARPPDPGHVRLFVYANAPQAFPLASSDFQAGSSYVLFVQDLAAPAKNTP